MKIAFLLYPVTAVKIQEDSSFWIMLELLKRRHRVFYFESKDLFWQDGSPQAFLRAAKLHERKGYLPSPLSSQATDLSSMDCIFIRKEPPFDTAYLYALQMLDAIKNRVFILNDPAGIAMANEKLFSLHFNDLAPESLVTEEPLSARRFIKKLGAKAIVKPLDQKGGVGIFSILPGDKNLPSLLEIATRHGREKILVQRYIPAERWGDKRIVLLNGNILGAFLRRPSAWDVRANLSAGATMHAAAVTPFDRKIVQRLAPVLLEKGLYFVGIDVIGKYLTEINVTSPAGIPELNSFEKKRLEKDVADFIESSVRKRS